MKPYLLTEILELPVDERIRLVEIIWESVAALPEAVQLSDDLKAELDRRLAESRQIPRLAFLGKRSGGASVWKKVGPISLNSLWSRHCGAQVLT